MSRRERRRPWRLPLRIATQWRRKRAALRRWGSVAKDLYRRQPAQRAFWLRALAACAWALGLMLGLHRWRHLPYALSQGKGLRWMLRVAPCNPWFYLQFAEQGRAATAQPERRSGYGIHVLPMARTLCFEFDAPTEAKAAIKLPIWASRRAVADITVLAKSAGWFYRPVSRTRQSLPRESSDSGLRIDIPLQANAANRRFRVYVDLLSQDGHGFVNLINTAHSIGHGLATASHGRLPKISIIAWFHGQASDLPAFMEGAQQQDYPGEMEILAIGDCGPWQSAGPLLEKNSAPAGGALRGTPKISCRLLTTENNRGISDARNHGLAEASGEIVLLLDGQGIPDSHLVSEHVFSHLLTRADVVTGPYLELEDAPAKRLASDINARCREASLRDRVNASSFLNLSARNLSCKRNGLDKIYFDRAFDGPPGPYSDAGWADLDLGVRLYREGMRICFNPHAYTLKAGNPPASQCPARPPLDAEENFFARLLRKHPELSLTARRWCLETHETMRDWRLANPAAPQTEDADFLANRLASPRAPLPRIKTGRPLRILTYRWHPAHQYEIYKTGHCFDLATSRAMGLTPFTEQWEYSQRPLPANAAFVDLEQIDFRDYDLALLHFDENVLDCQNTNGAIDGNFGASFRHFMGNVPLPKVAICHGTVQFHGMYNIAYDAPDLLAEIAGTRDRLVDYLGDTLVICNSHQAQREWGFRKSRVVWHGFDPAEFPESSRRQGILTLGGSLKERPHYRGYFFYQQTMAGFPREFLPSGLRVQEPDFPHCGLGNEYAQAKFRNYVDAIREYSIYFNPTLRSPMPRSRGEAMMCGLATVSAKNHDVDLFISNGKNGFYADEPAEAREYLSFLASHPQECERIGKSSRKTAADIFNHDRFMQEWLDIFNDIAQ